MVDKFQEAFPALLEIPSKDHPYGMHSLSSCISAIHAPFQIPVRTLYSSAYRSSSENKHPSNTKLAALDALHLYCIRFDICTTVVYPNRAVDSMSGEC